ncbi:hypothetical protein WJS89_07875 [Sphingomicrobium sp. XHP0235]|uniref:hypothetical protein n=1 Tax=Sphingomicrobium aquimarinum TaxID=3133971 RepID=UPI0031FE574B
MIARRRTLIKRRAQGASAYLLAIMLFVMTITAAAGLMVWNGNRSVAQAAAARHMVQLPGGIEQTDRLADFVAQADGVDAVRAVPPSETRATMERWMGPAARRADLPLPALVEVELGSERAAPALRAALTDAFPDARLVSNRSVLAPVLNALATVALVGLGLVLGIALAAAASIILATRAAIAANRSTISILHGMGASDTQIAQNFTPAIARDALVGGSFGTALAIALLLVLATTGGDSLDFLSGNARLIGIGELALLALLPLLAAGMAFVVARATILRDLRAAL